VRIALQWMGQRCTVEAPEAVARDVARLFSPLVADESDSSGADVSVVEDGDWTLVTAQTTDECLGHPDTLSAIELAVTRHLMAADTHHSHLHAAGALTSGGCAVLALGASGSGKSSLAYAWYRDGVPVLGDDVVFLDAESRAHAFPRPMKVDTTRLIDAGEPPEDTLAWDPNATEVWVDPTGGAGWAAGGLPVGIVADIKFVPDAETSVEEIKGPARLRLLLDSLHPSGTPRTESLDRLIVIAEQSDFYRVRFGNTGTASADLLALADTRVR